MKKLLFILLCLPFIGCGQTAEEYFEKGLEYAKNGEHNLAIDNYTKCIELKSADKILASAYYRRGFLYYELGKNEDAISDYTRAIRIDPFRSELYYSRGASKWHLKLDFCSDFKRGCDLGEHACCEWYDFQCK